jgi:ferredoxin
VTSLAAARITVDESLCASTGMSESVAPHLFEVGDDGALVVLQPDVPADLVEDARAAARSCPTRALAVS